MAITPMQKINIIGINSEKELVLSHIQKMSLVEIIEMNPDLIKHILQEDTYFPKKEQLELNIAEVKFCIDFLNKYYQGKKPGLLESFIGNKIKVSKKEFEKFATLDYPKIINQIKSIDNNLSENQNKLNKIQSAISQLENFASLTIPIGELKSLNNFNVAIGSMTQNNWDGFYKNINELSKEIAIETFSKIEDKDKKFFIIYPKNEEITKKTNQLLSQANFQTADFILNYNQTIKKEILDLTDQKNKLITYINQLTGEIQKFMQYRLPLMCYFDKLNWNKNLKETTNLAIATKYTFIFSAWARKDEINIISENLKKISSNIAIIQVEPEKNEQPPVDLENKKFVQPFEAVTNIYGMPKYAELDPTAFLALFFIIFLALCLTDAGYGLVLILITWWMLKKVDLPDKRLVILLHYGGWATLIIGALAGGWFGVEIDKLTWSPLQQALNSVRIVNPVENPLAIMGLSLALGIIQIWFGIFISFYWGIKHNQVKESIYDKVPWLMLIPSLIFFALVKTNVFPTSLSTISIIFLLLSVALVVISKGRTQKNPLLAIPVGVLGLYDLIGYFSDTLSYSRLLALGLATGIIGLVINMIADLFKGIPYVGWLIFILVLVGGHTFNLAINLLGAFIHSARLQYVEFFTKFMEGGGKKFTPFSKNSIYTNINE